MVPAEISNQGRAELSLEVVVSGLRFPEGPRWHEGALWFSDQHAGRILRLDPRTGAVDEVALVPNQPSGLGWDREGRLLAVSMLDRRLLRQGPDGLEEMADLSAVAAHHCNDMVVDAEGRAYIGNFGFDYLQEPPRAAVLVRVDPDGSTSVVAEDLLFPNGTVLTPDGATLVVAETFGGRLTAFDVGADGGLAGRRVWAQLPQGAVPDGICLDAEGAIWAASPTTNDVIRLAEGGEVLARIDVGRSAFACMLGGAQGRTLYICSANSSDPGVTAGDPTADIRAVEVAVGRAGRP
jgi:sugar lactone lactonase YvrE